MIEKPRIYILGRPEFTDAHYALLRDYLPAAEAHWAERDGPTPAERLIEFAGRVCYMSFGLAQSGKTNAEYIWNLIRQGHDSVLEHAVWTVGIAGVSRALTHQLVRHRAGFSYSQLSQQYHDESDANFVRPAELARNQAAAAIWDEAIAAAHSGYRALLAELDREDERNGWAARERRRALRSAARSLLPNATETVIVTTANARALRHFLGVRGATIGDLEMRAVSAALLHALRPEAPTLFADFEVGHHDDGWPIVQKVSME